ncbi:MAG TPA: SoxR reducing system RseC family protein [Spirochaetia bacterium]|nr:SoxR reducing system RseC family protein [Spirochaetia bacterium]
MEETGVVLEAGQGTARVRIERTEQCAQCPGCMFADDGASLVARAVDRVGVAPGDVVKMETRGASPLSAALLLFLLPLGFLLAGYAAGSWVASALGFAAARQTVGAAAAFVFFIGSFGILPLLRRKAGPVIVERLSRKAEAALRQ